MASNTDLARLAAAQRKLGREATPADVARFLSRIPAPATPVSLDQPEPVTAVTAALAGAVVEVEDEPLPAPRRRGRPPKVRDEA